MATRASTGPDPVIKAFISPQMILAVAATVGAAFTIQKADPTGNAPGGIIQNYATRDPSICTSLVITDVAQLPPSRLLAQEKIDDAIGAARQLLREKPHDLRAMMCAGNVFATVGDKEAGFKLLKDTCVAGDQSYYVHLNYAERLAEQKHYQEALDEYLHLFKGFPDKASALKVIIADLYLKTKQVNQCIDLIKPLIADKENPPGSEALKIYGLATAASGNVKYGLEKYMEASKLDDGQGGSSEAKEFINSHGGKLDTALNAVSLKIKLDPADAQARVTEAQLYISADRLKEAKATLDEAVKRTPNDADVRQVLAEVDLKMEDHDAALSEFKKAAEIITGQTIKSPDAKPQAKPDKEITPPRLIAPPAPVDVQKPDQSTLKKKDNQ